MSEGKNKRKNNNDQNKDRCDFSKKSKTSAGTFSFSEEFINILEDIEIEDTFFSICFKCSKEYIGFYSIPKTHIVCLLCR
jgi:hypothetical protein